MSSKPHVIKIAEQVPQGTRSVSMAIGDWTTIVNEHLAFSRKHQALEQKLADLQAKHEKWCPHFNNEFIEMKLKLEQATKALEHYLCAYCAGIKGHDQCYGYRSCKALALINADRGEKPSHETVYSSPDAKGELFEWSKDNFPGATHKAKLTGVEKIENKIYEDLLSGVSSFVRGKPDAQKSETET